MKTAMGILKEELQKSIDGIPEALKGINDVFIRKTVTDAVLISYKGVLKRIDDELLEKEKQQIIDAVEFTENTGGYTGEDYYNETFGEL